MALADTARLLVELVLRDRMSGPLKTTTGNLNSMDRTLTSLNTRVSRTNQVVNTALGVGLERLVTGGFRILGDSVRTGVAEMQRLEDATIQTQAALDSTRGVSGQTADGIRAMAEEFENLNATVDDKAIQEAANKLLTFTNIQGDVFKDALEASLDLSTRMEGDVQGAILQVGKALQDPIRGVTALRRAGVQLNEQQEAQIKTLVEQNRLYDAQQIILRELDTQVGDSFRRQGEGDAARAAALTDRIEDLQRVFATGLAPGLTRVREALIDAFDNPEVIAGVKAVGDNIGNFLSTENLKTAGDTVRSVFGFLGTVPWGAIGDGLRIVGQSAKLAIDAFNALPKEVQGIVIAGLAVNKLSGGIAGSLAVEGIKGLISGLRTITAANVTVVGGNVTGGGLPGTGGRGGIGGAAKALGAAAAIPLVGVAAVEVVNFDAMRTEAIGGLQDIVDKLPRRTAEEIDTSIARLQGQIELERPLLDGILFNTNIKPQLEREIAELRQVKFGQATLRGAITGGLLGVSGRIGTTNAKLDRSNSLLGGILSKNTSPIVKVTNVNQISSTVIQQRISQQRALSGSTGAGFQPNY